jgi:hypothetical protein
MPTRKHTCAFRAAHDPDTLEPLGAACGERATQELYWQDGRVSPSCPVHGMEALTEEARALVTRVTRPQSETEWATTG